MPREWDVFISHASEDKESIVRPLASKLRRLGLRVWVDENELVLGDSLSRKIDEGLAKSKAGVVILSPDFFEKNWPEYELRGLTARALSGVGRLIPVWHNVTQREVLEYSPTLADAFAGNTSRSLDEVALQIAGAANPDLHKAILCKIARAQMINNGTITSFPIEEIRSGPIRHANFPNALVDRIDLIRAATLDIFPQSRADWMEGFQRDTHPTREVEIWEQIAARYFRSTEGGNYSTSQKNAILSMLLLSSTGQNDEAATVLIKEFGDRAAEIFSNTRYNHNIFKEISDEDRKIQREIDVEIQTLAGPDVNIDLRYIEEIVAARLEL